MVPRKQKIDSNNNEVTQNEALEREDSETFKDQDDERQSQKNPRTSWWLEAVVLEGRKCIPCNFWTTSEHLMDDHYTTQHTDEERRNSSGSGGKRKRKVIPRLAENVDLLNLKLAHKNEYWSSQKCGPELKFKCLRCLESFKTREELRRHTKEAKSPDNLFVCQICQERKATKEDLSHHIGFKHHPKRLRCLLCRKLTEYCITSHLDYIYSVNDKNYDCSVCHKEFSKLSGLKRHIRS